jgi:ABC-type branched-subunit amino acid transport system substrate-binding protein
VSSASSAASSAVSPAANGSTVKIGIVAPIGTPSYQDPYSPAAARAAAADINADGGLAGHKVEIDYCNDKGDPNQTLICARQMVNDHVIATVGGSVLSDATLVSVLNAAHIPMVGFNPFTQFTSPNEYLMTGGSALGFQWLVAYVARHKIPSAFVSVDNATAGLMRKTLTAVAQEAGGSFKTTVLVSPTQADFSPIAQAASSAKAALLFMGEAQDDEFIKAAESSGFKLTYLSAGLYAPADVKIIGTAAVDRSMETSPFPPIVSASSNPMIEQYYKDMAAEAKTGDSAAGTPNAGGGLGFQAWLSAMVINILVKQDNLSDPTASNLTNALNSAKDINLDGVIPPWTPSNPGPAGFTRVSNTAYELIGYKNGQPYTAVPASTVQQQIAGQS